MSVCVSLGAEPLCGWISFLTEKINIEHSATVVFTLNDLFIAMAYRGGPRYGSGPLTPQATLSMLGRGSPGYKKTDHNAHPLLTHIEKSRVSWSLGVDTWIESPTVYPQVHVLDTNTHAPSLRKYISTH